MSKFLFTGLSLVLVATAMTIATDSADAQARYKQRVNNRQVRQQKRLYNGAANGQLTGKEAARLQKQQVKLARKERQMRLSGNGMTKKEAVRLEAAQDNLSQNVYQQKHDGQHR